MQTSMPVPIPEQVVSFLWNKFRPRTPVTFQDRVGVLRLVLNATTSLPVLTIATRDWVESEILARRRASENLTTYEQSVAVSPEHIDGQPGPVVGVQSG